jgi:DNA-directed RNA polymerase specialized sigma24 family protein
MRRSADPLPPPTKRRVPGESALYAHWIPIVSSMARKVFYPEHLSMGREDVEQDLMLTLCEFTRRYYAGHGKLPPGAYIRHALKWRVKVLVRASKVQFRVATTRAKTTWTDDEGRESPIDFPDESGVGADERLAQAELSDVCEALVYAVRQNLTPAAFAVMHLRYIEGLTPAEIAHATAATAPQVSKKLRTAKVRAGQFLSGLGIEAWEDVEEADDDAID